VPEEANDYWRQQVSLFVDLRNGVLGEGFGRE
jgi:hypothetical protein